MKLLLALLALTSAYAQTIPFTEDNPLDTFVDRAQNALQGIAKSDCHGVPDGDIAECFVYVGNLEQISLALQIAQAETGFMFSPKWNEWQDGVQVYQTEDESVKLQIIVVPVTLDALFVVLRDVSP